MFDNLDDGSIKAVVSPITLAECLVLPYKLGIPDMIGIFNDLLVQSQNVTLQMIDGLIANKAAELRARHNLTLTDAFQLAVAIQTGCEAFLTNDLGLTQVRDINVLVISE